jgi:hypothetical protein
MATRFDWSIKMTSNPALGKPARHWEEMRNDKKVSEFKTCLAWFEAVPRWTSTETVAQSLFCLILRSKNILKSNRRSPGSAGEALRV